MLSNKEINDYFLRFGQIHPIASHKYELYKNNKMIQYQNLLLNSNYDKEYIKHTYISYSNKFTDLLDMKEKIILSTKSILDGLDKEIEYINNTILEVKINSLKLKEYEL